MQNTLSKSSTFQSNNGESGVIGGGYGVQRETEYNQNSLVVTGHLTNRVNETMDNPNTSIEFDTRL